MIEIQEKINTYFNKLQFDSVKHTYHVDGQYLPSVSSLIKDFYNQFDREGISAFIAQRDNIPQDQLLNKWDTKRDNACDFGHDVHDFGENYALGKYTHSWKDLTNHHLAVLKFWDELPDFLVPITLELRMYMLKYGYAGTADIILWDKRNNTLVIADYKTNESLFKITHSIYGKKQFLKNGFEQLHETNFNKYQLQLSFYQILLEQTGYMVSQRVIIWLKPDGNYDLYDCEDYTDKLTKYLKER